MSLFSGELSIALQISSAYDEFPQAFLREEDLGYKKVFKKTVFKLEENLDTFYFKLLNFRF